MKCSELMNCIQAYSHPSIYSAVYLFILSSIQPCIQSSTHLVIRQSIQPSIQSSVHLAIRPSSQQSIQSVVRLVSSQPSVNLTLCTYKSYIHRCTQINLHAYYGYHHNIIKDQLGAEQGQVYLPIAISVWLDMSKEFNNHGLVPIIAIRH